MQYVKVKGKKEEKRKQVLNNDRLHSCEGSSTSMEIDGPADVKSREAFRCLLNHFFLCYRYRASCQRVNSAFRTELKGQILFTEESQLAM